MEGWLQCHSLRCRQTQSPYMPCPPARCRLLAQQREAKSLARQLAQLHAETSRLNGLLAEASEQRRELHEINLALESKLAGELRVGGRGHGGIGGVGGMGLAGRVVPCNCD